MTRGCKEQRGDNWYKGSIDMERAVMARDRRWLHSSANSTITSITHRIPPSMENITRYINQLTFENPNSPTHTHVRHQDSLTQSNSPLPPPSLSTLSSIQSRSESSLIRHARWVGEKLTSQLRRTSFARNPATTAD